jgi:hypothetical protein
MARVMAWTGSRWADAKVWTGSAWKSFVPDVYGANVYTYDMNSGPQGWVQELGAGGETPALNWSNIHLYGNDFSSSAYGTGMQLRRRFTDSVSLAPGTTVHIQASLLLQRLSGTAGTGTKYYATVNFGTGLYDPVTSASLDLGAGWTGWATIDSRSHSSSPYVVPENGGNPTTLTLNMIEVECVVACPIGGPYGQHRFFCDWVNLIDQNGNLLKKLTASRVPNLRAWDGSAWV